ncbi:hypothetical protein K435DRAFT_912660 [Dendrothele bispora CBS 962.96]|uniref:Uncharacterized protein n=1 Tax=Dendrothele bispora (strain CBS 962.96) TaxID=1314807 RepID=A0A4S8MMY2_DENBC|nr:hypothetical protein K435DRAFT_912660 [Dendrothele bispora CBS 962.96]
MSVLQSLLRHFSFDFTNLEIAAEGRLQLVHLIQETPIGKVYSAFDHRADRPTWYAILCIMKLDDDLLDEGVVNGLELLRKVSSPDVVGPWSVYGETICEVEFEFLVIDFLDEFLHSSGGSISSGSDSGCHSLLSSSRSLDDFELANDRPVYHKASGPLTGHTAVKSGRERNLKGIFRKIARRVQKLL